MDDLSMRDITAMMRDEDRPESLEMGEYVGNYSGDRIRFPGIELTGGEGNLSLAPAEVRGDCRTEVWFADKDCKYLVFQDTDGDVAILDIHHLLKRAAEVRREYDEAKAEAQAGQDTADKDRVMAETGGGQGEMPEASDPDKPFD